MQPNDKTLSRSARRSMARMEKHKGRKPVGINNIEVALNRVAKLTHDDQCRVMGVVNLCFHEMKQGTWREPEWNTLADVLNIAAALASPFNICSDHIDKFHKAMERLADVAQRVKDGFGWQANAQEINAMEKAVEFFCYQIQFASRGEYFRAIDYARNKAANSSSAIRVDQEAA